MFLCLQEEYTKQQPFLYKAEVFETSFFMILGTFFKPRGSIFEVPARLGRPFGSPEPAGPDFSNFGWLLGSPLGPNFLTFSGKMRSGEKKKTTFWTLVRRCLGPGLGT